MQRDKGSKKAENPKKQRLAAYYAGVKERIWTSDTRLRRAVLYPAELLGHVNKYEVFMRPAQPNGYERTNS